MPKEKPELKKLTEEDLEKMKTFRELFGLMRANNPEEEYKNAYEEAAEIAKNLIETKAKELFNVSRFKEDIAKKYPTFSKEFILTLTRCIENYNPIVNIPNRSLWDIG